MALEKLLPVSFVGYSIRLMILTNTSLFLFVKSKAYEPMLVTELGIETDFRPEQPEKAYSPIVVTKLGMVMEVRPEHPSYL